MQLGSFNICKFETAFPPYSIKASHVVDLIIPWTPNLFDLVMAILTIFRPDS